MIRGVLTSNIYAQVLLQIAQAFVTTAPYLVEAIRDAVIPFVPVISVIFVLRIIVFFYHWALSDDEHIDEMGYDGYVENMFDMVDYDIDDDDMDNLSLW